jgi:lipid A ethanolaminephosphotransferase
MTDTENPPMPAAAIASCRRRLHLWGFILLVAFGNACIYQGPLYAFAVTHLETTSANGILTLATLFFLVVFTTALLLGLLGLVSHHLLKPVCLIAAMGNALALYFLHTYRVVLDKSMMGNVFNTNLTEAGSYFHVRLLLYLLVFGVLPCLLLARVRIRPEKRWRRLVFLLILSIAGAGWFYANARTWLWIDKNASRLGGMILPWSYVFNSTRYYADYRASHRTQTRLPAASFLSDEKTIVILVIGEAARRQDFALYGYPRQTNPLLAGAGIVALPNARACATYTTASVLCILSHIDPGRGFSQAYEPLPSYLSRHGIDVIWRTNNWGEPPLKVQTYQRAEELRRGCQGEGCAHDEVLLSGLAQRIGASPHKKVFVVLHQGGSHGPSYYAKYPARFGVFKPVCTSVDLSQCSNADLVNAYDNTIVYTDYFLQQTIDLLKTFPKTATALMYISDHGESLGEYGLYLHGTPYAIAPDVQKDIPFLVWTSERFRQLNRSRGTKQSKPSDPSDRPDRPHQSNQDGSVQTTRPDPAMPFSQQDIFHSVMGAFDMRSDIYQPQHDIFRHR